MSEDRKNNISEDEKNTSETEKLVSEEKEDNDTLETKDDKIEEKKLETEENDKEKPVKKQRSYRFRYGASATVFTVIVVAAVILVNVIAGMLYDRYPANIDLTKEKLNTLSEETKELASTLDKDVEIVIFGKENVFSDGVGDSTMDKVLKEVHTSTQQLSSLSKGKITTKYIDPENPSEMAPYSEEDINALDVLFKSGGRSNKIAFNDLYSYNADQATQAITDFASEVEKMFFAQISKVTSKSHSIVTILAGHEEDASIISAIETVLTLNGFDFETLDISTSKEFNKDSKIALLAFPKTDYSAEEISKLRKWIDNDGELDRHLFVLPNFLNQSPELYEFLEVEYGIEVTNNTIFETELSRVYNYQEYLAIADVNVTELSTKLDGQPILMPSAIQLIAHNPSGEDATVSNNVIASMPNSAKIVDYNELKEADDDSKIKPKDADDYPISTIVAATKRGYNLQNEVVKTNVIVVGGADAFSEVVLKLKSFKNEELLVSMFKGVIEEEDSFVVSNKPLEMEKLEMTTGTSELLRALFQYIIPGGLLLVGILVFVRRRRL